MSYSAQSGPVKQQNPEANSKDETGSSAPRALGQSYDEQVAELAPVDRVKAYKDGEVVDAIEVFRGMHHVSIKIGDDDPENIDHAYVFHTEVEDATILADMAILEGQTEINEHFDDGRLRSSKQQTQNGQMNAPRKLMAIMKRQAEADTRPARVLHAVERANRIVQLHPYANGNGRTALYALYEAACTDDEVLDISALDLHRMMFGENNEQRGEEDPGGTAGTLVERMRLVEDEETKATFLATRMTLLETLEDDRAQRIVERREAAEAARVRRPGGATMFWERDELEELDLDADHLAALIERGWLVVSQGEERGHIYDGYQVYLARLNKLYLDLDGDEEAQELLDMDEDDLEAFLDATISL